MKLILFFVCLFVCLKRSLQQKIHNWKKVFPRKEKLSFRGRREIQVQEHAHIIIDRYWRAESIKYYIDCNSLIAQMAVLKIHFSEWFVNVQVIGPQISISFSSFTAPTSPKTKENKTAHFRTMQLKLFPLIFIVIYVPFDHLGKFSMIGLWWKFKMGKKYIISPKSCSCSCSQGTCHPNQWFSTPGFWAKWRKFSPMLRKSQDLCFSNYDI